MPGATERPMGTVVGRQPEVLHIIPSKPSPWYGTIVAGQPLTIEQRRAVEREGLDPATVERMPVRRNATDREYWWPLNSLPPVFEFECPVLRRRADGRVHVIAPDGSGKFVFPDGWTTRRPARRKWGRP